MAVCLAAGSAPASRSRLVRLALSGLIGAVAVAVALTGCANSAQSNSRQSIADHYMRVRAAASLPRTPTFPYSSYTGNTPWLNVKVGDCVDDLATADYTIIYGLDKLPCSDPHDGEIYAKPVIDGTMDWPGKVAIDAASNSRCQAAIAQYLGVPLEQSSLDYSFYPPTRSRWQYRNDRFAVCVIYRDGRQSRGSVQGTAILGYLNNE